MSDKYKVKRVLIFVLVVLNVCMIGVLGAYVVPAFRAEQVVLDDENEMHLEDDLDRVEEVLKDSEFSFVGVGDHFIYPSVFAKQVRPYNFDLMYENTNTYTQGADLAFVNCSTLTLGDTYNMYDYSLLNGPTELMDGLIGAGFDWVSVSSEHVLDYGVEGLQAQLQFMKDSYSNLSVTGAHQLKGESPVVREVNGIRVGLASYMMDVHLQEDQSWMLDVIDLDVLRSDMAALNTVSDVQFVALHWGTEFDSSVEAGQKEIVKCLNECGVEVILGSHPHVLKPVEMFRGPEQDTLVYYSLGNFMSVQNHPSLVVGGMASFDLKYDFDSEVSSFKNVKLIPTFSFASKDLKSFSTNTILDVTKEMEEDQWQQTISGKVCTKEFMNSFVKDIMEEYKDENIEVVYSE